MYSPCIFRRPGPGGRRLPAPHGPCAAGAGRALRVAGAAAAAAGFARDAGIEAAAGDASRSLALRLAVAQRLVNMFFEACFSAKLNAKHFITSDADLGKRALQCAKGVGGQDPRGARRSQR